MTTALESLVEVLNSLDMEGDRCGEVNQRIAAARAEQAELLESLRAVVGHGYCPGIRASTQDYVEKSAIAKVREILDRHRK